MPLFTYWSPIHGRTIVVLQYFDVITEGADGRLQKVKSGSVTSVDKGSCSPFHVLGEQYTVISAGNHFFLMVPVTYL